MHPDSPAAASGLQAHTDYVVGTPDLIFNGNEDFYSLVKSNVGKSVPLYVYSSIARRVRLVCKCDIKPIHGSVSFQASSWVPYFAGTVNRISYTIYEVFRVSNEYGVPNFVY